MPVHATGRASFRHKRERGRGGDEGQEQRKHMMLSNCEIPCYVSQMSCHAAMQEAKKIGRGTRRKRKRKKGAGTGEEREGI